MPNQVTESLTTGFGPGRFERPLTPSVGAERGFFLLAGHGRGFGSAPEHKQIVSRGLNRSRTAMSGRAARLRLVGAMTN
jgi:hypothetical protein